MQPPLYVLILAGGSGERFWPLSRKARPKQLLPLVDEERTLLESTLARLEGLVPMEQVLVLTNVDQVASVREVARQLPPANIVAEPAKRDTAAAIALAVGWIRARSADATMVVLSADHVILDVAGFQATLRVAAAAAEQSGDLVTIGIKPTWPCTGFGYIEQGKSYQLGPNAPAGPPVHEVVRFREKPDAAVAESFLKTGNFWWNAGIFVWTIECITAALGRDNPELCQFVEGISKAGDFASYMDKEFPLLPKISIDYAVLEKAPRVLMVEAGFDWDDVGSWPAIAKYFLKDEHGNQSRATVRSLNAHDNIVFSNQKAVVALVGVSDLIVVQTGDALLVCHRNDAEKIKHLMKDLPPELH